MGAAEALGGLFQNVSGGAFGIRQDLCVPQADDRPPLAPEESRAVLVVFELF